MHNTDYGLTIIGGGLSGCEAALQAAKVGINVKLVEMRPFVSTGAHTTGKLGELVCSNSLGSNLPDRASGLLKMELRKLGSFLIKIADECSVPAGRALAVDRNLFASKVTDLIESNKNIDLVRTENISFPEGISIIATGPLTSKRFAKSISKKLGQKNLFFFDAISPILDKETIDFNVAFMGSRYEACDQNQGDYINLPFSEQQYHDFIELLKSGKQHPKKAFELDIVYGIESSSPLFFEGCLPVEVLAHRGIDAMAFGPMRPVGLNDPHSNKRPYAVIQLRREDLAGDLYNMVGFQTNLTYGEQLRIFRSIPGLNRVEFIRFGSMHRNSYVNSPLCLYATLELRNSPGIFVAGQLTGIEGYAGNIGSGLLAGLNAPRLIQGKGLIELPCTTILGSLCKYISSTKSDSFQPMKANFGLLPPIPGKRKISKRERNKKIADRSNIDLGDYLDQVNHL